MTTILQKTAFYTHEMCLLHDTGRKHPENPKRLKTVLSAMYTEFPDDNNQPYDWTICNKGSIDQVLTVHKQSYIDHIQTCLAKITDDNPRVYLDEDTIISARSLDAALYGVGAACQAIDDVYMQHYRHAFCLTRPPGHHALRNISMGFCLFGNVAIAAKHALKRDDINKVAIIDFDVHQGNGTEDLVKNDPNIIMISLHQDDIWPYEHHKDTGPHNTIHNIPMPKQASAEHYHATFDRKAMPLLQKFDADFVIISAGFDAHKDDPPVDALFNDPPGRQSLTEADFDLITKKLITYAHQHAGGRLVSILEGGYNPDVLAKCCVSHAKTLVNVSK